MSDRNDNYFDLDNFDDSLDNRRQRSRQPNSRQSSYNGRPGSRSAAARKRKEAQRRRRIRNRAIIIGMFVLILVLIIILFSLIIRGCSNRNNSAAVPTTTISTDTINKQNGGAASPDQASAGAEGDLSPTYFKTPNIPDDNTNGYLSYAIYVWHNTGYELFGGSQERSQIYAETVNDLAGKLSGVNVYDMIIPNHTEFGLPQRLKDDDAPSTSQADSIKDAYSALSNNVKAINPYNYLADHNSEYIYFKSDHHWTGLGAYYAYKAFADTNKLPALDLKDCTEQTISGFTGTFSNTADGLDSDEVHYWDFPYTVTMDITDESGSTQEYDSPYYENAAEGSLTYGVFIMGDNPLTVLKSSSENAQSGKKIAIVKESYGNAIAPYFTNNYEEVHVVDFRYFRETIGSDLATYCADNGITDLLFVNGVMSANTQIQLDSMTGLFN